MSAPQVTPVKTAFHSPRCTDSTRGAALVISLYALLLLSVLILAFFSQTSLNRKITFSSASQARANLLAMSSLNAILADFVSEIQNGSTLKTDSSGITIYDPSAPLNMVPSRMTTNISYDSKTPINLIKWSSGTYPLWPATGYTQKGPTRGASGNSTTKVSLNGRYVDTSRWTKVAFNPSTSLPSSIVPDWVLMTRQGPISDPTTAAAQIAKLANANSTNASYVIGRYAYMIYDTGGSLDINAAGFPPSPTSSLNDVARKGNQGYADLTQLGMNANQVSQLISWRNAATASSISSYTNYLSNKAAEYGFLKAASGDNAFINRQDFLRYWTNQIGASTSLLPYFTTFSREKNAPSWGPTRDASSWGGKDSDTDPSTSTIISYAYKTDRDKTSSFNRFFPNVRVKTAFQRLSYIKGSTTKHQQAIVGEPLVKNRFDLAKLAWITHDKTLPSGVTAADIYNYFGLTRNSDGSWTYNHGQSDRIMTLDEVANAKREPDFFELLQATILRGSMGLCSGDPTQAASQSKGGEFYRITNPLDNKYTPIRRLDQNTRVVNAQEKYQIIQIGANIIDQYDSDNFPTEILLNGEHFYGIENLPYINTVGDTVLRPSPGSVPSQFQSDYQIYLHRWLTFSLWNPHQNATQTIPSTTGPTNIRIAATSGILYPSIQNLGPTSLGIADVAGTGYKGRNFTATSSTIVDTPAYMIGNAWIGLKLSDYNFSEPQAIDYDKSYTSDSANPSSANMNDSYGRISTALKWKRAGIYLGWRMAPDNPYKVPPTAPLFPNYNTTSKSSPVILYDAATLNVTTPITVELQYESPDTPGTWHTYQILSGFTGSRDGRGDSYMEQDDPSWLLWDSRTIVPNYPYSAQNKTVTDAVGSNGGKQVDKESWNNVLLDPRTTRLNMAPLKGRALAANFYNGGSVDQNGLDLPHFIVNSSASTWVDNLATANSHYSDRDTVFRPGDSGGWLNASPLPGGATTQRPIQLNRPFRSVAELGYVFRDDPWKTLNLTSTYSADIGLLDVFYIGSDSPTLPSQPAPDFIAGKVNINSAVMNCVAAKTTSSLILQALISQTLRDYSTSNPQTVNSGITTAADISGLATDIVKYVGTTPLLNISDLAAVLPQNTTVNSKYPGNKAQREAIFRALVDSTSTRTWNLLIDIIVQVGKYNSKATSLDNFTVDGEKHYWLHVAIDRFTGEIVDQQLEPVAE